MSSFLTKHAAALEDIKRFLLTDLAPLKFQAAQIYGSSTYERGFIAGASDIDICVYTDKMGKIPDQEIVDLIKRSNKDFRDKSPVIIDDYIAHRIEFYVNHPTVPFDITILSPEIPKVEGLRTTSSYDGIDMIIGALYQHGKPLFGTIPEKEMVEKDLLPFYSDDIRQERLDILGKRLARYTKRVERLTEDRDPDLLDHLYKTRNHFIKWLFIYKRKYPVCLHKHLKYQLDNILHLDPKEQEILFFTKPKDIYGLSRDFLDLSKKYYMEYNQEKQPQIISQRRHFPLSFIKGNIHEIE